MNRQELIWFRDNVAIPKMQQLLQNTTLPEGYCCITSLDVSILDGRSCGIDSELKAEGLLYKNGKVELYTFETYDFEATTFFEDHKSSIFLSEGKLHIWDELQEMEMNTILGNLSICAGLFPELKPATSLTVESHPLEYLKAKDLYEKIEPSASPAKKAYACNGVPIFDAQGNIMNERDAAFVEAQWERGENYAAPQAEKQSLSSTVSSAEERRTIHSAKDQPRKQQDDIEL